MGLFDFLKGTKKKNTQQKRKDQPLVSPVSGKVIAIEDVDDPVFSQKMMGDGFGVEPTDGTVYSPGTGKVVSVFPTQHAVGLELENGIELLVHIGIDTVELEGGPFQTLVKEGDKVTPDTPLSTVNLSALKDAGKKDTVVVVLTNMDQVDTYALSTTGMVDHGAEVGTVYAK